MNVVASPRTAFRGQPLIALATIVLSWVALRIASYDLPKDGEPLPALHAAIEPQPRPLEAIEERPSAIRANDRRKNVLLVASGRETAVSSSSFNPVKSMPLIIDACGANRACSGPLSVSPQYAWRQEASAIGNLGLPTTISSSHRRAWSFDAWLLLRDDTSSPNTSGLSAPTYGGSQAGAVVRFSLDADSQRRPVAYVRAIRSLRDRNEGHLAVGLSARPVSAIPIDIHFEGRTSLAGGSDRFAPAAFVSGGIDRAVPAFGASARGYVQAGYVGGRADTYFMDGSIVLDKTISSGRNSAAGVGLGMWGGAQDSVERLDLGPSADVAFPIGPGFGRLEASYRVRIGGEGAPDNGAAVVTLSASY